MASAKEIIAEGLLGGKPVLTDFSFEVCDEAGRLLLDFPFSEAAAKPGAAPLSRNALPHPLPGRMLMDRLHVHTGANDWEIGKLLPCAGSSNA